MYRVIKVSLLTSSLVLAGTIPALAQTDERPVGSAIGVRVGYAWTPGDWSHNRVAPAVAFLGGSVSFGGEIEIRVSDRMSIALDGGYLSLDGGDWVRYAAARGEIVRVSASIGNIGILLKPYLLSTGTDQLALELGVAATFASGQETVGSVTYDYDFFGSFRFGGLAGLEYARWIGERIAVTGRIAGVYVPSGVQYADGLNEAITLLPVTIGLRVVL